MTQSTSQRILSTLTIRLVALLSAAVLSPCAWADDGARAHYDRACRLLDTGKLDEAIEAFGKAIVLRPAYPEAYSDRGAAYRAKGDYGRAVSDLTRAVRLRPSFKAAVNNLAYTYRLKGDFDRAITTYRKAAALDPKNSARWEHLAVCQCLAGRYRDAAVSARRALRLDPRSVAARRQLGLAYAAQGDSGRAWQQFREALPRMRDEEMRESVRDIQGVQARNPSRALLETLDRLTKEIARRTSNGPNQNMKTSEGTN
jgi:tetratricopeptide (TPR) repeat protein